MWLTRNLFSHGSGACQSMPKGPAEPAPCEGSFCRAGNCPLAESSCSLSFGTQARRELWSLFLFLSGQQSYQIRTPPSWPHLILESHWELGPQHVNFGRIQFSPNNLKRKQRKWTQRIKEMFTIAHCLPSALPWPNFNQLYLLPTDPWTLLVLNPSKHNKNGTCPPFQPLLGISWPQGDPFPIRPYRSFPVSSPKILLISVGLCFTLFKKNLEFEMTADFWDLRSLYCNIQFLKLKSLSKSGFVLTKSTYPTK